MLSYIVPFLVLILVVVFIHEYGHYYFARKYGVGVTDFSIGFGKELRVDGKKKDDLQEAMHAIKSIDIGLPIDLYILNWLHIFQRVPCLSFQPNNSLPNPMEKSVTPTPYFLAK